MQYNLNSPIDRDKFLFRAKKLADGNNGFVELIEKRKRSLSANNYLHLLIGYLATVLGEDTDFVKQYYYKRLANPYTFIRVKEDPFLGRIKILRSSADLTVEEMANSIEKFKEWTFRNLEIVLPDAEDSNEVLYAEYEINKHRKYL